MTNIRRYTPKDYPLIKSWWDSHNEPGPLPEMLPSTTFILECDNKPKMALSLYLTNTLVIGYLENFVKSPDFDNDDLTRKFLSHVETTAKNLGVKLLLCMSYRDKLKARYESLGYKNTLNNLSSFVKEL